VTSGAHHQPSEAPPSIPNDPLRTSDLTMSSRTSTTISHATTTMHLRAHQSTPSSSMHTERFIVGSPISRTIVARWDARCADRDRLAHRVQQQPIFLGIRGRVQRPCSHLEIIQSETALPEISVADFSGTSNLSLSALIDVLNLISSSEVSKTSANEATIPSTISAALTNSIPDFSQQPKSEIRLFDDERQQSSQDPKDSLKVSRRDFENTNTTIPARAEPTADFSELLTPADFGSPSRQHQFPELRSIPQDSESTISQQDTDISPAKPIISSPQPPCPAKAIISHYPCPAKAIISHSPCPAKAIISEHLNLCEHRIGEQSSEHKPNQPSRAFRSFKHQNQFPAEHISQRTIAPITSWGDCNDYVDFPSF
jgi:hypothetical protein